MTVPARATEPGRRSPRQARSRETRRALVRTAARLWGRRGFDAVTVEEICAAAGVGRTTFYLHFRSKEELLASLAGATSVGVESDLAALGATASLDDQLEGFVHGVVRRVESGPRSLAALVIRSRPPRVAPATPATGQGRPFAEILGELLEAARRRGELGGAADPAELGRMLGALTMDAIESWAVGQGDEPALESVLRDRFDVVLAQFRPVPGDRA